MMPFFKASLPNKIRGQNFKKPDIIRPHPYTDSPLIEFDNAEEIIPEVTIEELIETIQMKRKKKSVDAHGISNFMFNFLSSSHWSFLLQLYNMSFQKAILPNAWKDTRMILLAKKESICPPASTRPISLLDVFQKVGEKLFLTRFKDVLSRRGLLPDNQSGFRDKFRLQTRLLLFLEDVYSLMSNSSPVCTIFVDFRSAFDQLWILGCIGKLRRLGIPLSFLNWIEGWLVDRRGFIEINNKRSRWFSIEKGGPQGGILTPTLFISYHCDMGQFLSGCASHFFADDLAAILAGQLGVRYTDQCLDLEKRIKSFLDHLEYYAALTVQPINFSKTEAVHSARAIGSPKFDIVLNENKERKINWVGEFKYLGYWISPKLSWGNMINKTMMKIRQRVSLINAFRLSGMTSPQLRRVLFSSYVLPLFTWIFPIYPFFTDKQKNDLSHFYFTCLRRVMFCLHWNENFFAYAVDEISLEDRCSRYWNRYLVALADSIDGELLIEKSNLNEFRKAWQLGECTVKGLRKSKRFVEHISVLEKVVNWIASTPSSSSTPYYEMDEVLTLINFPDTFV
jgi:hypothetical protein